MKTIGSVLAAAFLAGCAATNRVDPETMQIATQPLVCRAGECTLWWQRARQWVTGHTQYALQTDTSQAIETSGPTGGSGAPAFQVTLARNPDGSSTIGFAAHCDRPVAGCRPDPWNAAADFKQFVRSGAEPAQGQPPR
ncbi:hypothetical protein C0Z18_05205 [Trinickia dabaoshanensis]|uniref:Lipoprotein n=1 Tax=Trinickia dabaoshanensis TaxID=564714 RepID=A0A2N7VZX3_9BURK|nr:hypothetical protein [Trinickia dabaoshanensis]PMS22704.1 hypothetical protein C0Z18_05205 [Trinickia dabaoshanensis]